MKFLESSMELQNLEEVRSIFFGGPPSFLMFVQTLQTVLLIMFILRVVF